MDSSPIILDISSDDDLGRDDFQFDLIAEFLREKEESDDVVVLGEIPARSALRKQNHQQFAKSVKSGDKKVELGDDDDDCLILDGDPDKATTVDNGEAKESDELFIVREKGQIALRDYPHPRHHCATYPFKTTSPQKHCNLCHCYVCDSIAPCIYWGTGVSNTDHCHATDKEEIWKLRRQSFKEGKTVLSPAPKQLGAALSMAVSQHSSSAAVSPSRPVNHGSLSLSSQSQSNTLRSCSSSSYRVPNIISQRSDRHLGFTPQTISSRNNAVHHANRSPFSRHTINATNNVTRRRSSALGPHFASPHANFKRVVTSGVTLAKSQAGYSTSFGNSDNQMSSLWKNHHSQVTSHGTRNQGFLVGSNSQITHQSSSQPSMGGSSVEVHPRSDSFQPQICSQPDPLLDRDTSVCTQNSCQSSSQPAMGSDFLDFHWIDSPRPEVYNQSNTVTNEDQNAHPLEGPHPEITSLNLSDYNWSWLDDPAIDPLSAAENLFNQAPEPPPENNPNPQFPRIDDTSTEIFPDSWNEPLDQNAMEAAKDAVSFEFDFGSHESDFYNIMTFV